MQTGCHYNQCTDYKSFAKRKYFASAQIVEQQPCSELLTNIFSYCRFGVWGDEIFVWGRRSLPPLSCDPAPHPLIPEQKEMKCNRLVKILLELPHSQHLPVLKWNICTSARFYECGSGRCNLCLEEKIAILKSNKRHNPQ